MLYRQMRQNEGKNGKITADVTKLKIYLKEDNKKEIVFHSAMQVLAAGTLKPEETIEYICRFPKIESILFGASSSIIYCKQKN